MASGILRFLDRFSTCWAQLASHCISLVIEGGLLHESCGEKPSSRGVQGAWLTFSKDVILSEGTIGGSIPYEAWSSRPLER